MVLILLVFCFFVPVAATDNNSTPKLTLTPLSQEINLNPGDSVEKKIIISGDDWPSTNLRFYAVPYGVSNADYTPDYKPLDSKSKVQDWIKLSSDSVEVQSTFSHSVSYRLSVPEGTRPGSYSAVIFAEINSKQVKTGAINTLQRLGQMVYVTVNGDAQKRGQAIDHPTSLFYIQQHVPLTIAVKNDGDVYYKAKLAVDIYNLGGKKIYSDETEKPVLPQTERNFQLTFNSDKPINILKVKKTVSFLGTNKLETESWILVVQPWFMVFFAAVIVILLVLAFMPKRKKKWKNI